jgi:hypothetical protein
MRSFVIRFETRAWNAHVGQVPEELRYKGFRCVIQERLLNEGFDDCNHAYRKRKLDRRSWRDEVSKEGNISQRETRHERRTTGRLGRKSYGDFRPDDGQEDDTCCIKLCKSQRRSSQDLEDVRLERSAPSISDTRAPLARVFDLRMDG